MFGNNVSSLLRSPRRTITLGRISNAARTYDLEYEKDAHNVIARVFQIDGKGELMLRKVITACAVTSVLAGTLLIISGVANASEQTEPSAQSSPSLAPTFQAGHAFYTDAQIDAVWQNVTKHFPAALPEGIDFAEQAPAFFHPNDKRAHLFESDLPSLLAARVWRCAWLETSISSLKTEDVVSQASARTALEGYRDLPAVSRHVNVEEYQLSIDALAKSLGTTTQQAEYGLECDGSGIGAQR